MSEPTRPAALGSRPRLLVGFKIRNLEHIRVWKKDQRPSRPGVAALTSAGEQRRFSGSGRRLASIQLRDGRYQASRGRQLGNGRTRTCGRHVEGVPLADRARQGSSRPTQPRAAGGSPRPSDRAPDGPCRRVRHHTREQGIRRNEGSLTRMMMGPFS